jgi:hypothetical protein
MTTVRLARSRGRLFALACLASIVVGGGAGLAMEYPLALTLEARAKNETATVTSKLSIRIERLLADAPYKRVSDALRFGGYPNFLNTLRPLPVIGTITLGTRKVDLRYARESQEQGKTRLLLVADRPLFFLGSEPSKPRAGYELTIVELFFDDKGAGTGRMAGAARVKPTPDGGVALDDFADVEVQLSTNANRQ